METQTGKLTWTKTEYGYESGCGRYRLLRMPSRKFNAYYVGDGTWPTKPINSKHATLADAKALCEDHADSYGRPEASEGTVPPVPELTDAQLERARLDAPPVLVMDSAPRKTKAPKDRPESVEEFAAEELEKQQAAERAANRKANREAAQKKKGKVRKHPGGANADVPRGYAGFLAAVRAAGWTPEQLADEAPRPQALTDFEAAVGADQLAEWVVKAQDCGDLPMFSPEPAEPKVCPVTDVQPVLDRLVYEHGCNIRAGDAGDGILRRAGLDPAALTEGNWAAAKAALAARVKPQVAPAKAGRRTTLANVPELTYFRTAGYHGGHSGQLISKTEGEAKVEVRRGRSGKVERVYWSLATEIVVTDGLLFDDADNTMSRSPETTTSSEENAMVITEKAARGLFKAAGLKKLAGENTVQRVQRKLNDKEFMLGVADKLAPDAPEAETLKGVLEAIEASKEVKVKSGKGGTQPSKNGNKTKAGGKTSPKAPAGETDALGTRLGTNFAKANSVLSKKPKKMSDIVKEAGLSDTCYNHMNRLVKEGKVKKSDAGYALA